MLGNAFSIAKDSFAVLKANDPLRMAGATAFFTTFALPPILMIIVRSLGIFFNKKYIGKALMGKLSEVIGAEGGKQVYATIKSVIALQHNELVTAGIFIFLLFVATTLFKVIKGSLNQIWSIQIREKRTLKQLLRPRLHALVVILSAGLLFLAVLATDSLQAFMGNRFSASTSGFASYLGSTLSQIVSIVVITGWFLILFYYLPDGRPKLKHAFAGALLTSILFNAGKFLLRMLLGNSNVGNLYGTSGALVLVLLFVFYSSFILYFGASFIKVWSVRNNAPIRPLPYAARYSIEQEELKHIQAEAAS